MNSNLTNLLTNMHARQASDLHLVAGYPPMYRIHGELSAAGSGTIAHGGVLPLVTALASDEVNARLSGGTDFDFAVQLDEGSAAHRFRVNVFFARGECGACIRAIPAVIPDMAGLGFPGELADRIAALTSGLVLVTGITGSGKTTSIASLIQLLNSRGGSRIITIEEPIEYLYPPMPGSLVTQREVGVDVPSFYDGLRYGLRQDPDVLLVGEIRDRETAQLALSAAETGHLIFSTLHTPDAKGAVSRLIDLFPPEQHDDIRSQLSMSLRFVIAQHLLQTESGGRRVLALEVMFASFGVRSAIRAGKIESLDTAIQSGRREGMWSLDADLKRLLLEGKITIDTARAFAKDPEEFGR